MKSPPSLPKLPRYTLVRIMSLLQKGGTVHGNTLYVFVRIMSLLQRRNCTWEYKLRIKFIRNEGEGASYSCNIGQEIARGKAFKNHTKSSGGWEDKEIWKKRGNVQKLEYRNTCFRDDICQGNARGKAFKSHTNSGGWEDKEIWEKKKYMFQR